MASQTLQRITIATIILLVNTISTALTQCPQDQTQAGDIICTVNRNAFLPSPAVALVHCETDQPGGLLMNQVDALTVANTQWRVDNKACFFRHGGTCTHLFIRIDSPPTQQQIEVCRFQWPSVVCTCIDLTEPMPPTTISTDPPTTTISTDPPTTTISTNPPTTTESSTTTLAPTTKSSTELPSLDNSKGGVLEENAGFIAIAAVCVGFTVVIIVLSIILAVTCWHKGKTKTMTKEDIELASSK